MSQSAPLNLHLHKKQGEAFQTIATEVLYGGAAGGGKSHLMRLAAIIWCAAIGGLQVYLFRRIRDDLVKNHMEGPKGFRALLAGWVNAGLCQIVEDEIRFWNGSKIYLCHCKDEKDIYKYQGAEIHVLLIDELTHFTESMYRFLRNRVRMVGVAIPANYAGMFPRILCGANPGNIGHLWVKRTFIDGALPMALRQMPPVEGGMLRQYIPAHLEDNPSMATDDPGYESRLEGLGSDALVKAMRWGDWDIIEGAFFDCWDKRKHVIRPITIPEHWTRICGFDWGSASPFSVGWWAISSEAIEAETEAGPIAIPRGALIRYREWYGCARDESGVAIANKGIKLTNVAIGKGIKEREGKEKITLRVADPSIEANRGGITIHAEIAQSGVYFQKGDNTRVAGEGPISGWAQVRQRMVGQDGAPMLYVFNTCVDFIRTVPALQHDKNRPEDLDSSGEDHIADETRYVCLSRPWIAASPQPARPAGGDYNSHRRQAANGWKTS
jgi:hypothetical protein